MARSRYEPSRTLVRSFCRLPGEDPECYRRKIARLRAHFERFNQDAAELCQWFMGLRKRFGDANDPASFGTLGDFLLEPTLEGVESDERERDRRRLAVFDDVAGFRSADQVAGSPMPQALREAMNQVAAEGPQRDPNNATARRLFERLARLQPAHRLVLLKAAAEWIVARYERGMENWVRRREEWEKEKAEWERRHPGLTREVRDRFTEVFKSLKDPDEDGRTGVRRKNPRVCPWERLRQNMDNCIYAGQKGHVPRCWKYDKFIKEYKKQNGKFNEKRFWDDAQRLVTFCAEKGIRNPANVFQSPHAPDILFSGAPPQKRPHLLKPLKAAWNAYLKHMELNAETVVQRGRLPHCRKIGETFEKSKCEWNPHTELCNRYRRALAQLPEDVLALEGEYREWRKLYLAPPRKPSFKYPSARDLPMPKIFGEGFHEVDLDRAVLRLRLDDMPEGEWIEFGFRPWPRKYTPSKKDVNITSVHIHFVGTRARVGFRFDAPHRKSRFACAQDEIDELRSREFPRRAQDREFLDAARERLLGSFPGGPEAARRELRVLAVDLGMTGAHAAVYEGTRHKDDVALPINKIDRLYSDVPEKFRGTGDEPDPRGLRKEHVGRHLERIAEGASKVAEHRQKQDDAPGAPATLEDHDFRRLKRHIAWMVRDWARLNASRIVAAAEEHHCDLIVFESLRGTRVPGYDQLDSESERKKAEGVLYAYGRVRRKVTEKAVERGMRTVTVPYFKSSRVCSACGHEQRNQGRWRKNKRKGKFICECAAPACGCGAKLGSDANAARVLARVFWGEITLPEPD